jgi:hypothetical protein
MSHECKQGETNCYAREEKEPDFAKLNPGKPRELWHAWFSITIAIQEETANHKLAILVKQAETEQK